MDLQRQPQQQVQLSQEQILLQQHRSYLASVRPKTPIDVLRSPNRSLAYISAKDGNDAYVKAILSILISDTADFLNIGKTINGSQVMQTVELILEDFSVYKVDFFIACFNKAKKGHYGKQYDRLDGQIIFEWLTQYEYEYQSEIERLRLTEKTLVEKGLISLSENEPDVKLISGRDNTPVPMPDYVKKAYMEIIVRPVTVSIEPAKTEAEMFIDSVLSDFEILHKSCGIDGSVKMVPFYGASGRTMNIQDYIECRVLANESGMNLNDCLELCLNEVKNFHSKRFENANTRKFKK